MQFVKVEASCLVILVGFGLCFTYVVEVTGMVSIRSLPFHVIGIERIVILVAGVADGAEFSSRSTKWFGGFLLVEISLY